MAEILSPGIRTRMLFQLPVDELTYQLTKRLVKGYDTNRIIVLDSLAPYTIKQRNSIFNAADEHNVGDWMVTAYRSAFMSNVIALDKEEDRPGACVRVFEISELKSGRSVPITRRPQSAAAEIMDLKPGEDAYLQFMDDSDTLWLRKGTNNVAKGSNRLLPRVKPVNKANRSIMEFLNPK